MMRVVILVTGGVGIAAAALVLIWAFQRRVMYFPSGAVPAPEAVGLSGAEAVTFDTADGLTLHGWFLPVHGRPPRATVLALNGNAGNRAFRAPLAGALHREGCQVLLIDYRGYGGNPGTPTEGGLAADARAARAYLIGRPDVDPARLVYFGESLGTAVAVRLAEEHRPAALILRSPFTSMTDVGQHHYPLLPVRLLLSDRFETMGRIGRVGVPLLVIAGDRDRIVPFEFSRRVFDAAEHPKTLVVIRGANHNDRDLLAGDEMIQAILRLLQTLP